MREHRDLFSTVFQGVALTTLVIGLSGCFFSQSREWSTGNRTDVASSEAPERPADPYSLYWERNSFSDGTFLYFQTGASTGQYNWLPHRYRMHQRIGSAENRGRFSDRMVQTFNHSFEGQGAERQSVYRIQVFQPRLSETDEYLRSREYSQPSRPVEIMGPVQTCGHELFFERTPRLEPSSEVDVADPIQVGINVPLRAATTCSTTTMPRSIEIEIRTSMSHEPRLARALTSRLGFPMPVMRVTHPMLLGLRGEMEVQIGDILETVDEALLVDGGTTMPMGRARQLLAGAVRRLEVDGRLRVEIPDSQTAPRVRILSLARERLIDRMIDTFSHGGGRAVSPRGVSEVVLRGRYGFSMDGTVQLDFARHQNTSESIRLILSQASLTTNVRFKVGSLKKRQLSRELRDALDED